jgi:putative intracellular protease/amidase
MNVLIPLPSRDSDPSEVAVSWRTLTRAGHEVRFATPNGQQAQVDPLMLSGEGLDLWGWIPIVRKIKLLGLFLRANATARQAHQRLLDDAHFKSPLRYADLRATDFDGLLLPGGHWSRGAICHGTVLAARSISKRSGKSVLYGKQTTGLTWQLENAAWTTMKFAGRFWNPAYYRTYLEAPGEPKGFRSVQAEVTRALAQPSDFKDVARNSADFKRKTSGMHRDSLSDERPAFVVRDGNYLSARWPGDVHTFARRFGEMLND